MGLSGQVWLIARRSIVRTFRQPSLVAPTILFPLMLLGLNASGLSRATDIPGFPGASYVDFGLTVCFMQGALFSATTAGTELATDIETGFINRLQLTPLRQIAVLAGHLAGALTIALLAAVTYLVVGLIAGVEIKAGVGGAAVLLVLSMLVALAFAGIGAVFAATTGSAEAVQGLFPLLFVTFFLSSLNLPRPLITIDWFRTVATWNPVSYMIEGMRSLIVTGWDGTALWKGFLITGVVAALGLAGASRALSTRLART